MNDMRFPYPRQFSTTRFQVAQDQRDIDQIREILTYQQSQLVQLFVDVHAAQIQIQSQNQNQLSGQIVQIPDQTPCDPVNDQNGDSLFNEFFNNELYQQHLKEMQDLHQKQRSKT